MASDTEKTNEWWSAEYDKMKAQRDSLLEAAKEACQAELNSEFDRKWAMAGLRSEISKIMGNTPTWRKVVAQQAIVTATSPNIELGPVPESVSDYASRVHDEDAKQEGNTDMMRGAEPREDKP